MSRLIQWIVGFFTKERRGVITERLIENAERDFAKEILNAENQGKAYEFVKRLHENKEMTNAQKARVFNRKMAEWALKCGKVLAKSVVNCLREMALAALKAELGMTSASRPAKVAAAVKYRGKRNGKRAKCARRN